ncbi:hypothetical protein SCRM01_039 [Synechococcus phage S-CRM01]|nr:hypothetical protein SCRM01_039 [Synechococcus phage S-CRM01]AEC52986.1 hypothetical protein SCRM01_039 [Synechococcus phage S-CRM01]
MKLLVNVIKSVWKYFIEEPPGVYYRGGYLYENTNKPTTPRPLKLKRSK